MRPFLLPLIGTLVTGAAVTTGRTAEGKQTEDISFVFALFFAPAPAADPESELARLMRDKECGVRPKGGPSAAGVVSVVAEWMPISEFKQPSPERYRYAAVGLTKEEGAPIAQSTRVFVLTFSALREDALAANQQACQLLGTLADSTHGLPWDEETREIFSSGRWRRDRIDSWENGLPDVRKHVTIHSYRNPDLFRNISLGMGKFCRPDLVVIDVPSGSPNSAANLMNACAQALVEGRVVGRRLQLVLKDIKHSAARAVALTNPGKGARGRLGVEFKDTPWEEGDPRNELWLLEFPGSRAASYTERLQSACAIVFGSTDEIKMRPKGDREMAAASARARDAFFQLEPTFRKGLAPNERLLVKAPFAYDGGNEYMWVEVLLWKKDSIEGVLANDPYYVQGIKAGSRVTVRLTDVYDYIHYRPDGTEAGNETGKVLRQRE